MIRHSARLLLPRGRYSAMMDLGGAATAESTQRIDTGKNNKIKAVALDFYLITRSLDTHKAEALAQGAAAASDAATSTSSTAAISPGAVQPNTGMIENLANLLNVDLGGTIGGNKSRDDDDLSPLTGDTVTRNTNNRTRSAGPPAGFNAEENEIGSSILSTMNKKKSKQQQQQQQHSTKAPPVNDVRSKYADKLRRKLDGGLAGVESAKMQREDALKKGDAAGHLAARRIASAQPVGTGSKWLAATGTGSLLTYLTNRSMKIALLPIPNCTDEEANEAAGKRMDDLQTQLAQVNFDVVVKEGHLSPSDVLRKILAKVDAEAGSTLVVSDRDDYLREAKDRGFYTCRIRPMNAPRGNVTTSYTVADVKGVEEVCNELNGISFNTVFAGVGINHGGV
eukprot:CAMPEP_0178683730 /NCGR_PEP_ID=MMETSP0699-20121125/2461_1 /TAXON_ID=265572 /ORGANISM="Extubocellulus spinifer, Strain CCMP396" /LENGTH=394 /DNA_ID=CAMNT_0020328347 /DNA_START=125 /DNA_END=1309 /DNA_ORIENTATION=+